MSKFTLRAGLLLASFLAVLLVMPACTGGVTTPTPTPAPTLSPTPTPKPTPSPAPLPAPAIKITAPSGNIVPQIGNVTVTVEVTNFTLVDKLGKDNVPGEGHIHYFLDVDPPTAPDKPAVTAAGTYAATAATSYTWTNVSGGPHKFSVELVNNNHTPLVPPVVASVQVTVLPEIGPPSLVITAPKDGAQVPAGNVVVSVQTSNFNIVDKLGKENVSHEGHLHYFMDVEAPTTAGKPAVTAAGTYAATANTSYTWTNVAAGAHTFSVELVNNDHTPLEPPVVAKVAVTVTAAPATPTPSPSPTPTPSGASVTINIAASGFMFDRTTITVPAGAAVTVNFTNKDAGVPHNVAFYNNGATGVTFYKGEIITGPASTVYTFTAPTGKGTYFFRCDVHPTMNGQFIVN